jgi:succinate dehydrogenase/fumarate reductase flavoprotein subunit
MWKNKPPFRLCLNKAASDEIIWHCKHYTGRGVMKFYASGADLAKDMGIDGQVLVDMHNAHFEAAKMQEKDPEGGKWQAYPSGKCWDEASGKTGSGKKFYHNVLEGSKVLAEPFYVAIITPVIHYCMGGLEIDVNSSVIGANGKAIPGLYCAERLQVVFMATTALVATPFLTASSLVEFQASTVHSTCSESASQHRSRN